MVVVTDISRFKNRQSEVVKEDTDCHFEPVTLI